jgi:hypothetical protein
MKRVFGWVTPELEYFACDRWQHWTLVNNTPKLRAYVPNANRIERELAMVLEVCQDEDMEWHRWEFVSENARSEAIEELYKAGCVRLADDGMDLNAEGIEAAWTPEMEAFLKKFAEDRGYKLCREVAKWVQ